MHLIHVVVRAKNPCLVGLSGIVVHETENAFRVVTEKNQTKSMVDLFVSRIPMN